MCVPVGTNKAFDVRANVEYKVVGEELGQGGALFRREVWEVGWGKILAVIYIIEDCVRRWDGTGGRWKFLDQISESADVGKGSRLRKGSRGNVGEKVCYWVRWGSRRLKLCVRKDMVEVRVGNWQRGLYGLCYRV